ncbi:MAG TPA: hypothetical protein VFX85_08560 [Solirubrobacterales bacterium]|nr:hypothetical protein [Solirubrobacterales bacterium]
MAEDFVGRTVQFVDGTAEVLEPTSFGGQVSEAQLEQIVLQAPEALGEELLPLGHQLADFSEDLQRLDVLALDKSGEIVLVELKVDEEFGFTDVQALAYAGGYANLPTSHYAETLHRAIAAERGAPFRAAAGLEATASLEEVRGSIAEFLSLDSFTEWKPSQQVRIKLVGPGFTKRVLKNVKWLGDVYQMPIEAIRVQLVVSGAAQQLSFDRILPLPGDEAFDLTVREREVQLRAENEGRRRRVRIFPLLIDKGVLKEGDRLWLVEGAFKAEHRHLFEAGNPTFSGEVGASPSKLRWQRDAESPVEEISPASLVHRICEVLLGEQVEGFGTAVASNFTLGRDGPTLEALAEDNGLWT